MNRNLSRFLPLVLLLISSAYAVRVGEPAPDFQATDSSGQVVRTAVLSNTHTENSCKLIARVS